MTKFRGLRRRILAGGMALLLSVATVAADLPVATLAGTVSGNDAPQSGALLIPEDEVLTPEDESKYAFDGIKYEVSTLTLNGNELTEDTKVKNGDNIKIAMSWIIGDQTTDTHFETDLTPIVHLKLAESTKQNLRNPAGDVVGTFYITDAGTLVIDITDPVYFAKNSKYGNVQIGGVVSVTEASVNDGDPIEIQIESKKYKVKFDSNTPASQLNASKTTDGGLYYDTTANAFMQKFDLTVTAQYGKVTNIQLTDEPGSMLSNMSNITIVDAGGTALSDTYADFAALNAALASEELAANKSIRLQYTMQVAHGPNASGEVYQNKIETHYDNNHGEPQDNVWNWARASADVKNPNVTKEGKRLSADNGEVEWTITLDMGDYQKLIDEGKKTFAELVTNITDVLGSGYTTTDVTPAPILSDTGVGSYTYKGNGIYQWTCKSTIDDAHLTNTSGVTMENEATVTVDGKPYKGKGEVTIPGKDWLEKKFESFDRENKIITWTVTLTPPKTATNVKLIDQPWTSVAEQGQHDTMDTIIVDGVTVVANGVIAETTEAAKIVNKTASNIYGVYGKPGMLDGWGANFVFQDTYINQVAKSGNSIKVTYQTKVSDASMAGKNYKNQAYLEYDDTVGGSKKLTSSAIYRDKGSSMIKNGEQIYGENAVEYKLITNLKDIDMTQKHSFDIVDYMPKELKYRDGSFMATVQDIWGNIKYTESSAYFTIDSANKASIKVNVTDGMIAAANGITNCDPQLIIIYRADVIDEAKLVVDGSGTYTNKASGKYGDEFIGEPSATTKVYPQSIIKKEYSYTESTAPFVEYTVEVNPNALKLVNGGKLTAVDKLGKDSALTYKLDTIMVQKNVSGSWVDMTRGTDYKIMHDAENNSVTISELPDSTYMKITYKCLVGLASGEGVYLTSDNATNEFSLSGINNDATKKSNSINRLVIKSSGYADSELGSIKLFKYWNKDGDMQPLEGAQFKLSKYVWNETTHQLDDDLTLAPGEIGHAGSNVVINAFDNVRSGADGYVSIEGLSRVKIYKLEEIDPPAGYTSGDPYWFVIDEYTGSKDYKNYTPYSTQIKTHFSGEEIPYENAKDEVNRTGKITFKGQKTLDDSAPAADKVFNFAVMKLTNGETLTPADKAKNPSIGVEVATTTNTLGDITFPDLNYSSSSANKAGDYYYKIYEKPIDSSKDYKNDISIDDSYYIVKVVVKDDTMHPDQYEVNVTEITKYHNKQSDGSYLSTSMAASDTFSYDFANTTKEKKGTYTFKAQKQIDGVANLSGVTFTDGFIVEELSEADAIATDAPKRTGTQKKTGSNNAYGVIDFGKITYSSKTPGDVGTHYYKVYEKDLISPYSIDYEKDYTCYIFKIDVTNTVGEVALSVKATEVKKYTSTDNGINYALAETIPGASITDSSVLFNNKSNKKTASDTLQINKTVDGAIPNGSSEVFNFKVLKVSTPSATTGAEVATGANDVNSIFVKLNGNTSMAVNFSTHPGTDEYGVGTHYFKVYEENLSPTQEIDYKKDESIYVIKYVVTNTSGAATLSVDKTIMRYSSLSDGVGTDVTSAMSPTIRFDNLKTPTALVEFKAKKTLNGNTVFGGKIFNFGIVKLTASDIAAPDYATNEIGVGIHDFTTGVSGADGTVTFEKRDEFSKEIEATGTHYYKIYEKDLSSADANDYEKDPTYYIVTVSVGDDGSGYKATKTEIKKYTYDTPTAKYDDGVVVTLDDASIAFNNKTKVKTGQLQLNAGIKTVDGATPSPAKAFDFAVAKLADTTWTDTALAVNPAATDLYSVSSVDTTGVITLNDTTGYVAQYASNVASDLGTHYYKIYEKDLSVADAADYKKDPNYYIVKVTVSNVAGMANLKVNIDGISKYTFNASTGKYEKSSVSTVAGSVKFDNKTIPKKGNLLLKKTVSGLNASTDPASYIEFRITPGVDGNPYTTYTLNDLSKSGNVYTKTISDVPIGDYTVKETKYTVDGHILSSIEYKATKEGGSPVTTNGTSADALATIEDGKTTSVEITDTYTPDEGAIIVSKRVTGGLAFNAVKDTLTFEVKNSSNVTVATITGSQLTNNAGTYSYKVEHLPSGTYTVIETCGAMAGYSRTSTYSVNSGTTYTGTQTTATVSSTKDATVLFTNNYEAQPIKLILNKTITGISKADADTKIIPTISFGIYKGASLVQTVTLTAADYNAGKYTKTITGLAPGSYQIKETAGNVGSFNLVATSFDVKKNGANNHSGTSKDTTAVALAFGDTMEVSYTNDYNDTSIAPYIRIGKSVKGDLAWDDIKNKISFTITDGLGAAVERRNSGGTLHSTIGVIKPAALAGSPDDLSNYYFELGADGNYYCTILLKKGTSTTTYNVTEICDMGGLSKYKLTRTYKVDSAAAQNSTNGLVQLTGYSDAVGKTVLYTNTYAEQKGGLQLIKNFAGFEGTDANKTDLVKNATYTITPGVDGSASSTYKISDFTKQSDGSYKLVFNNIPIGTYTVVETNTDVANYEYKTTSITVTEDGADKAPTSGLSTNVNVKNNALSIAKITNNYEPKKGNLVLTKTIKGDVTKEEAEGALVFTVKNNDTGVTKTYKLTDFDSYDAATRKYTKTLPTAVGGYTVTETIKDVNGYVLKEVNYDVDGSGTKTQGDSVTTTVPYNGTRTVDFEDDYAKDEGKLVITKTIKGDVTKEEAEGALQFTVLNNDTGHVDTYKLTDFTYDSVTGKYSKELTATSGGYTVTESIYDIHGYVLKQVTTSVNGGPKEDTNKATTAVTYNNTTTVDFEDEYTKDFGKLVITKTIKGDVTKEEAEGALVFTVKNNATGHIDTYKLTDFVYDGVTGMYKKELDCVSGGYTVSESTFDIAGHAIKTVKYSVNGSTLTNGNQTEVSIVKDQTTTVDFEDDYTDDSAKLLLTKTVWGYPSQAELLDTVKFEVKNNSTGQVFNFTLRDFTYDEVKDYYYKELATVPGGYTVTEYATNVSGLKLVCVAYTIGERENNYNFILEPAVIVELIKDKTYQVNFVNEYRISDWDISTPRKDTTTTITTTTKTTTTTTFTKIPKTGDDTPLKGMVAGAIASLVAGIGCMVIYFKKRKRVR